MKPYCK